MIIEKEALLCEREHTIVEKEAQLAERDRVIAVRDAELEEGVAERKSRAARVPNSPVSTRCATACYLATLSCLGRMLTNTRPWSRKLPA
jgi:hypothetical protein